MSGFQPAKAQLIDVAASRNSASAISDSPVEITVEAEGTLPKSSSPTSLAISGNVDQANDNKNDSQHASHLSTTSNAAILAETQVYLDVKATSTRQLSAQLASLGQEAANYKKRVIYDALVERQNMLINSATDGVALVSIPLIGLRQPHSFLVRFETPVSVDTPDGKPIDIVFMLLNPVSIGNSQGKSLQVLASVARLLKEPSARDVLQQASTPEAVNALLQTVR